VNTHSNVVLCMHVMFVNGLAFLTTISRNIMYRTAEYVKSNTTKSFKEALSTVFKVYRSAGFKIAFINCDNEFRPLAGEVEEEFQVKFNFANPQEHVPEAERNNRVIKERFRSAYHRLPYKALPKIMVKMLVMESAKKLNFFPPKGGISQYYSPRTIMHQRDLDYNKQCLIPFGTFVQAHDEPDHKNNQQPRSLDCIYMRYNDNDQGGHELLDLAPEKLIKI
jgi:hypothetical protein